MHMGPFLRTVRITLYVSFTNIYTHNLIHIETGSKSKIFYVSDSVITDHWLSITFIFQKPSSLINCHTSLFGSYPVISFFFCLHIKIFLTYIISTPFLSFLFSSPFSVSKILSDCWSSFSAFVRQYALIVAIVTISLERSPAFGFLSNVDCLMLW